MAEQDPWAEAAKTYPQNQSTATSASAAPAANEDWKLFQQSGAPESAPSQGLLSTVGSWLGNGIEGAGKGLLSTLSSTDDWARQHLPAVLTNSDLGFGKPADLAHVKAMATPTNTPQSIGKGIEQAGEFLIPGAAEEAGAAKLAELAPQLGKWATPAAKVVAGAAGGGLINGMQGGGVGTGMLMGGIGGGLNAGMQAVAPKVAETALNIRKLDRAYKAPGAIGRAILDETTGFAPGAVADSARGVLDQLNPELEAATNAASSPNSVMARIMGTPNIADLTPSRNVLQQAATKAGTQGERTTMAQLDPMITHLTEDIAGNSIPSDVTPRQLLDLKRGFGNEFIHRWNPDTMEGVKGTAANVYHQMATEFNDAVPEAQGLNSRISSLIPVAKRGESAELNAPTVQRAFNRIGAHTGALAGTLLGANEGYRQGGPGGAIAGGLTGLILPEMIASPTGEMTAARVMNSPVLRNLITNLPMGAWLQFSRPDQEQ